MNIMHVSNLFKVSPYGPLSARNYDEVHLRQGELDGACGPYCLVSALITLGVMSRETAQNMHTLKGSTRGGKFRDNLYAFGVYTQEGTYGDDLVWLTENYKRVGLQAEHVTGTKKQIFIDIYTAIDEGKLPIIGVRWPTLGGHWMLVVGYQGIEFEEDFQLTHLLCLDPGQEAPKASIWNAVVEVFNEDGSSVNKGRLSSNSWGMEGVASKCHIEDAVILSTSE